MQFCEVSRRWVPLAEFELHIVGLGMLFPFFAPAHIVADFGLIVCVGVLFPFLGPDRRIFVCTSEKVSRGLLENHWSALSGLFQTRGTR